MADQLALLPGYLTAHLQLALVALLLGVGLSVPLGVAITRGLLESIAEALDDPISLLDNLGASLARTAVFFKIYLALQTCFGIPFAELLRLVQAITRFMADGFQMRPPPAPGEPVEPPPPERPAYHVMWSKLVLAAAMVSMLDSSRLPHRRHAAREVAEQFGEVAAVQRWEDFLEDVSREQRSCG